MVKSNNAGWMVLEDQISEPKFLELLIKLLSSGKLLEKISYNCKKISKPYASKNLYKLVLGVLNEKFR
jgi:UDP-N-acetylglucosamine:LPS N-acetylglucosamine transferase